MYIELNEDEREILERLLEHEISDLGPEIRHTNTSSYRDDLKAHKKALRDLLERLHVAEAA
jgi:hypothetical protein